MNEIIDFPKIKSPFIRETISGRYIVTPKIEPGYEWVFEDSGVKAVDKLHGTNICVFLDNGVVKSIDNRITRILENPYIHARMDKNAARAVMGVLNALKKNWIPNIDGRIYGELIAPDINGNIHGVNSPYFVPFDYLNKKCHWTSWVRNDYPKTFESISEWFKELPSLFCKRMNLDGNAEGLIFLHPDGRRAKLRKDMFQWYKGNDEN